MLGFLLTNRSVKIFSTLYIRFSSVTVAVCICCLFFSSSAYGQSGTVTYQQPEITSLDLSVQGDFSSDVIHSQIATKQTPWLVWIFLNENISQSIGAPRAFFDPIIFYNDIDHLKDFFHERGYFNAVIDTTVRYSDDGKYVEVSIMIKTHQHSVIDTVLIKGLSDLRPETRNSVQQGALIKPGTQFTKQLIVDEQNRILRALHSNGYPKARLDSVSLKRYASTNNISVVLQFHPGREYTFGDVSLPEVESASAETRREEDVQVEPEIITRQLDFEKGEVYNEEKRIESERNLNNLGLFENASVRAMFDSTTENSSAVPLRITLRTLELQEITPEFLILSENNELFSTGLGLGYKHRNFFGGARNFSITARARVNRLEQLDFSGAVNDGLSEPTLFTKTDIQSQLIFPYIYSNKTRAAITFTAEVEKQPDYTLNTLRAKLSFITKLATYTVGTLDFNIERVDPKFRNAQFLRVEDTTKQFNFIEAITLQRDKTNNIFSPTSGFFHSASIEEAGVISKAAGGFQLPYSEYYKFSFHVKHYFAVEPYRSQVFAMKLRGGFAQLYNPHNSTPVPLPRRFFAGGSGSVRAWKDKQLAVFGDSIKGGNLAIEGSFESRTQMFPNNGKLLFLNLENVWTVLFLDYGNTWNKSRDVMLKDVALAVGLGLRYETFVGPFRFDLAWRLYDPKQPKGRQWLFEQQFFHNSFSLVHFGIGHAF